MAKREPTPEEREAQLRAFQDAARELECDEDEDAFKAKLRQVAKTPPRHREKAADKKG
ncbi:MAG TPA: hypothetical protein VL358_10350 [Caulobacteraceae bacterium]|jgi:hypothetical protein|nr:hypothetical protein [Caulobacteraceae bacterium]